MSAISPSACDSASDLQHSDTTAKTTSTTHTEDASDEHYKHGEDAEAGQEETKDDTEVDDMTPSADDEDDASEPSLAEQVVAQSGMRVTAVSTDAFDRLIAALLASQTTPAQAQPRAEEERPSAQDEHQ